MDEIHPQQTEKRPLIAAFSFGDTDLLLSTIADVAKAKGMAQIAQDTGLGRESLYKALSAGAKPRFARS